MKLAFFLFCLLSYSIKMRAEERTSIKTGNDLKVFCADFDASNKSQLESWHSGQCAGFIMGVVALEGVSEVDLKSRRIRDQRQLRFCVPENVENGQLLAVVQKYLENHPNLLHLSAGLLVAGAFKEAFSCN